MSKATIAENQPVGTKVGDLTTTGGTADYTYALVAGTGDADNASFATDGAILKTKAVFDYEKKKTHSVRIQTTDKNGGKFEKAFAIAVSDVVNEAPTGPALSANTIAENQPAGTKVGDLTSTGGAGDTFFTYALLTTGTGSDDHASFEIKRCHAPHESRL